MGSYEYMTDFDQDYVQWKAWESQAFCVLTAEQSRYFAAELRKTGQTLPAGAKVLEVGFGQGRFLAYARSQQWQVTGTELNPHLALRGKAMGLDVHQRVVWGGLLHRGLDSGRGQKAWIPGLRPG